MPEEEEDLRRWLDESPENERRYRQLNELWDLLEVAAPQGSTGRPPSLETILARAGAEADRPLMRPVVGASSASESSARVEKVPAEASRRLRLRKGTAGSLLAACFALIGLGVGLLFDGAAPPPNAFAETEITTGADERATVILADGTAIRVGPRSSVRLSLDNGESVAWLSGRAFFGVEPNPDRVFTVRTEHGEATALGTRFEVRSEERDFEVVVVEGNVRVSAAGATVEVAEGFMSRSSDGGAPSTSTVEDTHSLMDWMGATLVFRATPLGRAVAEIEHRYGVDVIIDEPWLTEVTVTATFIDQTLEEVALVVCEIVGADCRLEDLRLQMAPAEGLTPSAPTEEGGRP